MSYSQMSVLKLTLLVQGRDGFTDFIRNVKFNQSIYCSVHVLPLITADTWLFFVQVSEDKLQVEVCDQVFSGIPKIYKIN